MSDIYTAAENVDFGTWGSVSLIEAQDKLLDTMDYFDDENVMAAEQKRREMIQAAVRYYDGKHVKPLKIDQGEPDDNVIVNLCRTLVDDSVSSLFGDPSTGKMTFETDETDMSGDAGNWFDDLWEANGGIRLLKRLAKRGAISGHSFVKLEIPDVEGELPGIKLLDPLIVSMRANPSDEDEIVAYKIEWIKKVRVDEYSNKREEYIFRQLVVNVGSKDDQFWVLAEYSCPRRLKRRKWSLIVGPIGWPWPWSPILDCANIDPSWGVYGTSDLEDVAWLNDNINFVSSNTMRILKYHAHPKTIGTGFSSAEIKGTAANEFWIVSTADAKVYNLEMQSDLQSSLAMLDFIRGAFWTIGRGMDISVYKDKIGQITNFALRMLAMRSINKLGDKRISYGRLIRDINDRVQEMLGIDPPVETVINWPGELPMDDKEEMQILGEEVALEIVSKQTAAEQRGRNWVKESDRMAKEKQDTISLGEYIIREFDRGGSVEE